MPRLTSSDVCSAQCPDQHNSHRLPRRMHQGRSQNECLTEFSCLQVDAMALPHKFYGMAQFEDGQERCKVGWLQRARMNCVHDCNVWVEKYRLSQTCHVHIILLHLRDFDKLQTGPTKSCKFVRFLSFFGDCCSTENKESLWWRKHDFGRLTTTNR